MSIIREMYHSQEKWQDRLSKPVMTTNKSAWLGEAFYFWYYEEDAVWWGRTAKNKTNYFEVYKAAINCENVLDTVFNEEHYNFWINWIEKGIQRFLKKNRGQVSIKYLNDFFKEKGVFVDIPGVMFQDISINPDRWVIREFQYKKRIQLAVYDLQIITNFALHFDGDA